MRLLPVGRGALLAEVGSVDEALMVYAAARAAPGLAVTDIVPAARTVLFDGVRDRAALETFLGSLHGGAASRPGTDRRVEVPTVYDGIDLEDVARLWGMTREEAARTHAATEFVVAFCGFSPGFAYCTGLPTRFEVPRLDSPRPRVPAGSVAVAGEFTGVYPTASPGGWRLLGRTALTLWDPSAAEPATLSPGTRVRFLVVDR